MEESVATFKKPTDSTIAQYSFQCEKKSVGAFFLISIILAYLNIFLIKMDRESTQTLNIQN